MIPFNQYTLVNKLRIPAKHLWFFCLSLQGKIDTSPSLYKKLVIRKGKKTRIVWKVSKSLGIVHKKLASMLEHYPSNGYSFAYKKSLCAADAAARLVGYRYMYSLDIKNHFPSIRLALIQKCLKSFGMDSRSSFIVARLACVDYKGMSILAQGSSLSPILSNMVSEKFLDPLVLKHLESSDVYVRYSDNIYIATNTLKPRDFLSTLSNEIASELGWVAHKLKYMPYYRRQYVLGFTVNSRLNVPKDTYSCLYGQLYKVSTTPYIEEFDSLRAKARYYLPYLEGSKKMKINKLLKLMEINT